MKPRDTIERLMDEAERLELEGTELFGLGEDTLAREYNGIGPEFFPAGLRDRVTEHLALFEPAALIHDLRNYLSDGMRRRFHRANAEFLRNCRRCADAGYPWWSWRRYRARSVARLLFRFVDGRPGWRAWTDCHRRRFPEGPEKGKGQR